MKIEDLTTKFSNYIFGFEVIKDKTDYSELLDGKDLIPVFAHKSGSVVCIWENEGKEKIVWIDSEGTPCNVFAEKLEDFFEILPYGPNFIWDYLSKHENYLISPNPFRDPKKVFTSEYITETYIDNIEDKELFGDYCNWLKENELIFNVNPTEKISKILKDSDFVNWFST